MELPTYDGSGQVVHPDLVLDASGFGGHQFWLAFTPYPGGNAGYENPSLVTGDARPSWVVPDGVVNPIVPPPVGGHWSDPDIVLDATTGVLRYYFRSTVGGRDDVLLMTSGDGVHWSEPRAVTGAPGIAIVSPAVVHEEDRSWTMWSVNAVHGGCSATETTVERRTSPDGERWSAPATVELSQPGRVVWHLDVQWIPSRHEYWAIHAAYPVGSGCAATDLYFARSADGVRWTTYPSPLVARTDFAPFANAVYRSTFSYDAEHDLARFWLSGARFDRNWTWTAATVRFSRATLESRIATRREELRSATRGPALWDPSGGAASAENFP